MSLDATHNIWQGRDSPQIVERETALPIVPQAPKGESPRDSSWFLAVTQRMNAHFGTEASLGDRAVTVRDLVNLNLVSGDGKTGGGSGTVGGVSLLPIAIPSSPVGNHPSVAPPAPILFAGTAGLAVAILSWDYPAGTGPLIGYAEIYGNSTNDFGTKKLIGTTTARVYADAVGSTGVQRFYWLRFIGVGDTPLPGPFFSATGLEVTTGSISGVDFSTLIIDAQNIANGSLGPIKFIPGADNLLPDPGFYDRKWWVFDARTDFVSTNGLAGEPAKRYLQINAGGAAFDYRTPEIAIEQAGWYRVKVRYELSVDFTGTFGFAVDFHNVEWNDGAVPSTPLTDTFPTWTIASLATGSWQSSDHITVASAPDCNTSAVRMKGQVLTGSVKVRMEYQRATSADLLVAGSVIAGKIAADAVAAINIIAGSITGDRIAAATLTAANILAGTITGDRIAANTITATNIVAHTIQALQIVAGSITANEIAASTISADRLTVGAQGAQANILKNSDFTEFTGTNLGPTSLKNWSWYSTITGATVGRNFGNGRFYNVGNGGAYLYDTQNPDTVQFNLIYSDAFAVTPGNIYELSVYVTAINCRANMDLHFTQANGAECASGGVAGSASISPVPGGTVGGATGVGSMIRLWGKGVAPIDASFASIRIFKYARSSAYVESYIFIQKAFVTNDALNQSSTINQSPWRDGGLTTIDGHGIVTNTITADKITAGAITADKISVTNLGAISPNAGIIVSGILRNSTNSAAINLNAINTEDFIRVGNYTAQYDGSFNPNVALRADGSAYFSREVISKPKRIAVGNYTLTFKPFVYFLPGGGIGSSAPGEIQGAYLLDNANTVVRLIRYGDGGSEGGGGGDGGGL